MTLFRMCVILMGMNDFGNDDDDDDDDDVQTLTTKDCKGPQKNMPKNVGSYVLRHIRFRSFEVLCG